MICLCGADVLDYQFLAHRAICDKYQEAYQHHIQQLSASLGNSETAPTPTKPRNPLPLCEVCGAVSIGWKAGKLLCKEHWQEPVKEV